MKRMIGTARRVLLSTAIVMLAGGDVLAGTIVGVNPSSGQTTGGYAITISGFGFGASGNAVTLDGNECHITSESAGEIQCTVPEGTGAVNDVQVIDDTGTASNVRNFAYNAPAISSLDPSSGRSIGGTTITIVGENFGPAAADGLRSVLVGATGEACTLVPGAGDHDSVECTTPPGTGTDVDVVIVVDGQSSGASPFDYVPPPAILSLNPTSGSTAGNIPLTINGSNFYDSGNSVSVGGRSCPPTLESPSSIVCTLPEGSGANEDVEVTADGQTSEPFPFHYDAPEISSLEPGTGPTEGNVLLTIHGLNFGASSLDSLRSVTVGMRACPLVPGASTHERVECTLPEGQGAGQSVVVELDEQAGVPFSFSYLPPDIDTVEPSQASAGGGTIITIRGDHFGYSSSVTVDGLTCPLTMQSHSELRCTAPASTAGPGLPVVVDASGQSDAASIEYLTPACGNGIIDQSQGEVCDDDNADDLDGCSSRCETESIEDAGQQKCIVSLNKAAAKLFKAQGKVVDSCAKEASAGTACIGVYEDKQLDKAESKIAFALSGQCQSARPAMPIGGDPEVQDANKDAVVELARDFFGADPDAALVPDAMSPAKQDCQRDLMKSSLKVALTLLKSFGTCKKLGLKEETIRAPSQLGACLDTAMSDAKLDKPTQSHFEAFIDSCFDAGVAPAVAFPGACAAAPDVPACLLEQVRCRVCQAVNTTDGTDQDCDEMDDELDNESCM